MTANRPGYWNETYLRYWQQRTADPAPGSASEAAPPGLAVFAYHFALAAPAPGESVLEVGVGFGRLLPTLAAGGGRVYGVDIAEPMVGEARAGHGDLCVELRVGEAEALPYPDSFFEVVVCWAVFDAVQQERALVEMGRVLRIGGRLLLSGKNDDYHDDDQAAYEAELGARAKGQPNYFTHYAGLVRRMGEIGLEVKAAHFFARRGDSGQNRYTVERPAHFYEYVVVGRKIRPPTQLAVDPFSRDTSQTARRLSPPLGGHP